MSEVRLVSITQPVGIHGVNTAEEFIAYAARVSNPGNQINSETAPKLLRYLAKHKHWSPFEMVSLTMEIKTTRDIGRQILRHRSFSFQEFSQRYAEVVDQFEFREARLQDQKNRQNSIKTDDRVLEQIWDTMQEQVATVCRNAYDMAIRHGIAKEQARAVLPEGMTKSTMYMSGTLRSWIHYCELRMANGTQAEHMEIAKQAWEVILGQFPSLKTVLEKEEPKSEFPVLTAEQIQALGTVELKPLGVNDIQRLFSEQYRYIPGPAKTVPLSTWLDPYPTHRDRDSY